MTIFSKLRIITSQKQFLNILNRFRPTFLHTSNGWFSKKNSPTYYEILGLHQQATAQEIRNSFLKLSKQCHPDVTQNESESHNRFLEINEAYSVLSKPNSRAEYNSSLINESAKHENSESDIPNSNSSGVPNREHPHVYENDKINQKGKFSEASGEKDREDSFIHEMFRYTAYTVVLIFGIAFFIASTADRGANKLTSNPRFNTVYMGKDELERGQLLWKAEEAGMTLYFYAVDSELKGPKVYVVCRENEHNSTDYVYRVLTSYSRS